LRRFSDWVHLVRPALVLIAGMGVFLIIRAAVVPKDFGKYGHYRPAALDLVRSRQNIRSIPLDELEPVLADPAHRRPDRVHGSGEIREWLRGAMARLNPRIAQMFVLRFFEGKENLEIARLLNTTPGTVAVTLSRTRDRLEKEYRAYLGGVA